MIPEHQIPFRSGYQKALKEILEDLAVLHAKYPNEVHFRKAVDQIWELAKKRLEESRKESFIYGQRTE